MTKSKTKEEKELTAELLPPKGHEDVGYKVFEILDEILQDKNDLGLPSKWTRHYELSKNKHWKSDTNKATLISANLLFTHRQRTVNFLTDNNPTFNVARIGEAPEGQEEVYDKLRHTCEFWWNEQEQQHILEKSVTNGEMNGCTIEKVVFNPDLEFGLGEVETELVDPFHFGWYPVKHRDPQRATANLHFYPMNVWEARRRWPKFAKEIHSDLEYLKDLGDQRREVQGGKPGKLRGYLSTFGSVIKNMLNIYGEAKIGKEEVLIVECWVKDETIITQQIPVIDPDTGEQVVDPLVGPLFEEERVPKYTGFIRRVTTCVGGKVVLEDRNNPSINPNLSIEQAQKTYLFDRFPFSVIQSVTDTVNAWGMSDYEQLEHLNLEVDKTLSQFTLYKDKAARLKLKNPQTSGVENSELSNFPGIINPVNAIESEAIKYLDPPKIPIDLQNAIAVYKDLFFLIAGTFELEQAQTPGREVIAFRAIALLMEKAAAMLRGKIRNYSRMIRERGRMYISMAQNWYTEERWISYEEDGEEMTATVRSDEILIPAKLTVVTGSTLVRSRLQEREEAIELFKAQAIDVEELLKKLDWPERKKVLRRMMAGPLGLLFDKLMAIGTPEALIQLFGEIAQMDDKEFERELKKGNLPGFNQIMQALMQQERGEQPAVDPTQAVEIQARQADIQKTLADIDARRADTESKLALAELDRQLKQVQIEKVRAEIELLAEKTDTEEVSQVLKIEQAEVATQKAGDEVDIKEKVADAQIAAKKQQGKQQKKEK